MPSPSYISNVNVSPYWADEQEIKRKQRLAEMLQQQSLDPIQGQQGGAFASPISPLQVLAKGLQAYKGKQAATEAKTQQEALAQRQQTERQAALARALSQAQGSPQPPAEMGGGPAMPGDPMGAAGTLAGSQDPSLQQAGMGMLGQQFKNMVPPTPKPPEPYTLSPGAQRFGPDNKPLASVPFKPDTPQQPRAPQIIQTANGPMLLNEPGQAVPIPGPGGAPVQAPKKEPLVNVDMKGEGKYAEVVAGKSGERDIGQHDAAMAAVDNIIKLDLTLDQITKSQAITGMGSEVFKNIERAKALVMQDQAAGKKVSDTELLDALLGSDVFPMIKALGIGARGLDTPSEREFLRSVMTGTVQLNRETLKRMTELRRDISKRAVERCNDRVGSGELDRYFRASGMPRQKIKLPKVAGGPPKDVDPALWNAMTPEEKALWQTD